MPHFVLILGTRNRKKLGELVQLLEPLGIELKTLADYPDAVEVAETGQVPVPLVRSFRDRHWYIWPQGGSAFQS